MTDTTVLLYADETDPDMRLAWRNSATTLYDLAALVTAGWTLAVEIVAADDTLEATKTTGVTAGDGTGAHNVNIAWTAAELAPLAGAWWRLRLTATLGAERMVFALDNAGTLPHLHVRAVPA